MYFINRYFYSYDIYIEIFCSEYGDAPNKRMKKAGATWNSMSEEERQTYAMMASNVERVPPSELPPNQKKAYIGKLGTELRKLVCLL